MKLSFTCFVLNLISDPRENAGSDVAVDETPETVPGHAVLDLRAGPRQLGVQTGGVKAAITSVPKAGKRVPRRNGNIHRRHSAAARRFINEQMCRSNHAGRAGHLERQFRQRAGPRTRRAIDTDTPVGFNNRMLHGLRGLYRTGLGVGVFEGEKAEGRRQKRSADTARVHFVQTFFDTKRRGGGARWSSPFHHEHEHDHPQLMPSSRCEAISHFLGCPLFIIYLYITHTCIINVFQLTINMMDDFSLAIVLDIIFISNDILPKHLPFSNE